MDNDTRVSDGDGNIAPEHGPWQDPGRTMSESENATRLQPKFSRAMARGTAQRTVAAAHKRHSNVSGEEYNMWLEAPQPEGHDTTHCRAVHSDTRGNNVSATYAWTPPTDDSL